MKKFPTRFEIKEKRYKAALYKLLDFPTEINIWLRDNQITGMKKDPDLRGGFFDTGVLEITWETYQELLKKHYVTIEAVLLNELDNGTLVISYKGETRFVNRPLIAEYKYKDHKIRMGNYWYHDYNKEILLTIPKWLERKMK